MMREWRICFALAAAAALLLAAAEADAQQAVDGADTAAVVGPDTAALVVQNRVLRSSGTKHFALRLDITGIRFGSLA